jgi:hypothetical protein
MMTRRITKDHKLFYNSAMPQPEENFPTIMSELDAVPIVPHISLFVIGLRWHRE